MPKDITELAFKHFNLHINDKSESVLARMTKSFGQKAAHEELDRVADVLAACSAETPQSLQWKRRRKPVSFLPRKWIRDTLVMQWERSLPRGERIRFQHFGATGNSKHHPFAWADQLEK